MTAFRAFCTGSPSEPCLIDEIATGVTYHNMSHILTYFAYFRKSWSRDVDENVGDTVSIACCDDVKVSQD